MGRLRDMILNRLPRLAVWALCAVAGALLAMELSEWADRRRERMQPGAITGAFLNKVNEGLERRSQA